MRQRNLHLSRERDGLVGVRGALLPDVAAKLQTIIDACLSPKTAPAFLSIEEAMAAGRDADPRTRDQQRHDVFAGIVDTAARALDMPLQGGAAPVVAVAVTQRTWNPGRVAGLSGRPRSRWRRCGSSPAPAGCRKSCSIRTGESLSWVPGADLHRLATQGDHPAGWAVLHPRLHHARHPLRNPPRRSGRPWWAHSYR